MKGFTPDPDARRQLQEHVQHELIEPLLQAIAADARRLAPVDSGDLRDSITFEVTSETSGRVGSPLSYAADVELGTRPHVIRAQSKKVLADREQGEFFGKEVHHPGTPAQPYLRPALYRNRQVA